MVNFYFLEFFMGTNFLKQVKKDTRLLDYNLCKRIFFGGRLFAFERRNREQKSKKIKNIYTTQCYDKMITHTVMTTTPLTEYICAVDEVIHMLYNECTSISNQSVFIHLIHNIQLC